MKLRDVVAEFLADLTRAQHRTNELSKRLSEKYRDDRLLRFFPVPNALLDEAVVTLRFAPRGPDGDAAPAGPEPREPVQPHPHLALRLAHAVAAAVAAGVGRRLRADDPAGEPGRRMAAALTSDRVVDALAGRVRPALQAFVERAVAAGRTDELVESALRSIAPPLAEALAEDPDLAVHLRTVEAAVGEALAEPAGGVRDALAAAAEAAQALAAVRESVPSLDVIVDSASLAQFPEHAIHTLTLKAKLRNYRWVVVEREGRPDDDLLPEQ
jgi:hypothetical protein